MRTFVAETDAISPQKKTKKIRMNFIFFVGSGATQLKSVGTPVGTLMYRFVQKQLNNRHEKKKNMSGNHSHVPRAHAASKFQWVCANMGFVSYINIYVYMLYIYKGIYIYVLYIYRYIFLYVLHIYIYVFIYIYIYMLYIYTMLYI